MVVNVDWSHKKQESGIKKQGIGTPLEKKVQPTAISKQPVSVKVDSKLVGQLMKKDLIFLICALIVGGILIAPNANIFADKLKTETTKYISSLGVNVPTGDSAQNNSNVVKITDTVATLKRPVRKLSFQKPTTVGTGANYLLMGDSMMQWGFGSELENKLLASNVGSVNREAIQSTGLIFTDYYDWYNRANQLLDQQQADVAIVMWGLNDDKDMLDADWNYYPFGSDGWKSLYQARVDKMLNELLNERKVKKVVWVGLPIGPTDQWNYKIQTLNGVYGEICKNFINCIFVDPYDRFAVNGQYSYTVTNDNGETQVARQDDGLHVNLFGGEILANLVFQKMKENNITLDPK